MKERLILTSLLHTSAGSSVPFWLKKDLCLSPPPLSFCLSFIILFFQCVAWFLMKKKSCQIPPPVLQLCLSTSVSSSAQAVVKASQKVLTKVLVSRYFFPWKSWKSFPPEFPTFSLLYVIDDYLNSTHCNPLPLRLTSLALCRQIVCLPACLNHMLYQSILLLFPSCWTS